MSTRVLNATIKAQVSGFKPLTLKQARARVVSTPEDIAREDELQREIEHDEAMEGYDW